MLKYIAAAALIAATAMATVYAQQVASPAPPDVQALQQRLLEEISAGLMWRSRAIALQARIDELQRAQHIAPDPPKQ